MFVRQMLMQSSCRCRAGLGRPMIEVPWPSLSKLLTGAVCEQLTTGAKLVFWTSTNAFVY